MRGLVLLAVLFGVLATPAGANQWKVRDLTVDPASDQSKLMLVVSKTSITVVRRANDTVVTTINPRDVVSIWYDDKLIERRDVANPAPEYCLDEGGVRRLVRLTLNKKRLVLPVWEAACRRASEQGS